MRRSVLGEEAPQSHPVPRGGGQGRMRCAEPMRYSPGAWLLSILTTALLAHQLLREMLCHRACERVCA